MDRGGGIVNMCGERGEPRLLRHLHHCKSWGQTTGVDRSKWFPPKGREPQFTPRIDHGAARDAIIERGWV